MSLSKPLPTIALAVLLLASACHKSPSPGGSWQQAMLDTINAWRAQGCTCGTDTMPPVPPLTWNDTLTLAAREHVTDMYVHDYFDHIAPDGSSPIQRAIQFGFTGDYVGENIARGYTSLSAVMQAWKASPDHCQAMMDSLYSSMGAAQDGSYWDQEFGGY